MSNLFEYITAKNVDKAFFFPNVHLCTYIHQELQMKISKIINNLSKFEENENIIYIFKI